MRVIKFRGQTRRKGEYLINVAGDKCDSNWVYGGIFPQNEYENGFAVIYQQEPEVEKYSVYADTVGQYTGLKDKNGKEVYEGDIARNKYGYVGCVKWECCSFILDWLSWNASRDLYVWSDSIEVIGNIFDNPELIGNTLKPCWKNEI